MSRLEINSATQSMSRLGVEQTGERLLLVLFTSSKLSFSGGQCIGSNEDDKWLNEIL